MSGSAMLESRCPRCSSLGEPCSQSSLDWLEDLRFHYDSIRNRCDKVSRHIEALVDELKERKLSGSDREVAGTKKKWTDHFKMSFKKGKSKLALARNSMIIGKKGFRKERALERNSKTNVKSPSEVGLLTGNHESEPKHQMATLGREPAPLVSSEEASFDEDGYNDDGYMGRGLMSDSSMVEAMLADTEEEDPGQKQQFDIKKLLNEFSPGSNWDEAGGAQRKVSDDPIYDRFNGFGFDELVATAEFTLRENNSSSNKVSRDISRSYTKPCEVFQKQDKNDQQEDDQVVPTSPNNVFFGPPQKPMEQRKLRKPKRQVKLENQDKPNEQSEGQEKPKEQGESENLEKTKEQSESQNLEEQKEQKGSSYVDNTLHCLISEMIATKPTNEILRQFCLLVLDNIEYNSKRSELESIKIIDQKNVIRDDLDIMIKNKIKHLSQTNLKEYIEQIDPAPVEDSYPVNPLPQATASPVKRVLFVDSTLSGQATEASVGANGEQEPKLAQAKSGASSMSVEKPHSPERDFFEEDWSNQGPVFFDEFSRRILIGHCKGVRALALLKNGDLASCSVDSLVKIWSCSTLRVKQSLHGHTDKVLCLQVMNSSGYIVSGSSDRTIKVWDPEAKDNKKFLVKSIAAHRSTIHSLALFPDGNFFKRIQ